MENQTVKDQTLEEKYNFPSKTLKKDDINYVIYHNRCMDGFASALAAYIYLRDHGKLVPGQEGYDEADFDSKIIFYGANHWDNKIPDVTGRNVLICDFSFKIEFLNVMLEQTGGNLLILDHHKTAKAGLEEIDDNYKVFDMDHSGAYITWTYFFGFDKIPRMIKYVEDNDIWLKALPNTRDFTSFLFSTPFIFEEYEKFLDDAYLDNTVFPTGSGMNLQNEAYVKDLARKTIPKFIQVEDKANKSSKYYFVACLNSNILKSELGNNVLSHLPYANFSAIYSHDHYRNSTSFSLRSLNSKSDVSEVAKIFGGGGHRCASGMGISYIADCIPARIIDQYRTYFVLDSLYEHEIETSVGKHNVVMMNTNSCMKHLAKYLMQERTVVEDREEKTIQEALVIIRNKKEDNKYTQIYDGAVIWYYNGENIVTIGSYSDDMRNTILSDYEKYVNDYKNSIESDDKESNLNQMVELKYMKDDNLIKTTYKNVDYIRLFLNNNED